MDRRAFTQIDMKAGGDAVPMRCVQGERFGYIFTPWSDGRFSYRNNNEGLTMKAMVEAAQTDPQIAARIQMFRHRALEELYDLRKDPDCLMNLADRPEHKADLDRMRDQLRDWMRHTYDPLLAAFENRGSPEKLPAILAKVYGDDYTKAAQRQQPVPRGQKRMGRNIGR